MPDRLREYQWYRQLFDQSKLVQLLINSENGQIVDANPAALGFYGYTWEEFREMTISEINQLPEDQVRQELRKARSEQSAFFYFPHKLKDGTIKQVEVWSNPLEIDGRILLHSFIHDATTKMEALRDKELAQQRLIGISAQVPGVVYQFLRERDGSYHLPFIQGPIKEIYGYELEELLEDAGKAFKNIHPDDLEALVESIEYSAKTLSTWEFTFRMCVPNQPMTWLKAMSNPAPQADGAVLWSGILMDMTALKISEEKRAVYQKILLKSVDAVILVDEEGGIIEANEALGKLYKTNLKVLKSKSLLELFGPISLEIVNKSLKQKGEFRGEFTILNRMGETVVIDVTAFLVKSENNEVLSKVLFLRDVSEKREQTNLLANSEQHLTSLIEAIPDRLFLISQEGTFLPSTISNKEHFLYSEFTGKHINEIFSEPTASMFLSAIEKLFETRKPQQVDYRIDGEDGPRFFQDRLSLWQTENGGIGVLGLSREVTSQKKMEEAAKKHEKQKSLGVLAGGVAHDFNNLLTSILGNADLVFQMEGVSASQYLLLEKITDAAEKAKDLCGKMLAYSGRGNLFFRDVDVIDLLKTNKELFISSLHQRARLEIQHFDEFIDPVLIHGDPKQIIQILVQLLLNSGEAMPPPNPKDEPLVSIRIGLKTFNKKEIESSSILGDLSAGYYIEIVIKDNGGGMSQDTLDHLFEPFFSTKFAGRGLGLCAVLGIIKAHQGGLIVQSSNGSGTSVSLFFPLISNQLEPIGSKSTQLLSLGETP